MSERYSTFLDQPNVRAFLTENPVGPEGERLIEAFRFAELCLGSMLEAPFGATPRIELAATARQHGIALLNMLKHLGTAVLRATQEVDAELGQVVAQQYAIRDRAAGFAVSSNDRREILALDRALEQRRYAIGERKVHLQTVMLSIDSEVVRTFRTEASLFGGGVPNTLVSHYVQQFTAGSTLCSQA